MLLKHAPIERALQQIFTEILEKRRLRSWFVTIAIWLLVTGFYFWKHEGFLVNSDELMNNRSAFVERYPKGYGVERIRMK